MRAGVTFEEMLQDALRANKDREEIRGAFPPAQPHVFVHSVSARPRPKPTTLTAAMAGMPRTGDTGPTEPRPVIVRPAHKLTKAQQKALQELVDLGATLGTNFTSFELRSAFRSLARRYHPDRHPDTSDVEQARLARIFADLTQSYRCLLPVCEATQ